MLGPSNDPFLLNKKISSLILLSMFPEVVPFILNFIRENLNSQGALFLVSYSGNLKIILFTQG